MNKCSIINVKKVYNATKLKKNYFWPESNGQAGNEHVHGGSNLLDQSDQQFLRIVCGLSAEQARVRILESKQTFAFRREYWMIYRGPGFLIVVWFGFSPHPLPSVSCLFYTRSSSVSTVELTNGRRRGRSQIIRWRENMSSINHSTNTLWFSSFAHTKNTFETN